MAASQRGLLKLAKLLTIKFEKIGRSKWDGELQRKVPKSYEFGNSFSMFQLEKYIVSIIKEHLMSRELNVDYEVKSKSEAIGSINVGFGRTVGQWQATLAEIPRKKAKSSGAKKTCKT